MRDYQRQKCYSWEEATFPGERTETLTLDGCKELAKEMFGRKVKVKDGRGTRSAFAYLEDRYPTIGLPKWARNPYTVAHEVAHLKLKGQGYADHGGQFMKVMLELIAEHTNRDFDEMRTSAIEFGLRVAD